MTASPPTYTGGEPVRLGDRVSGPGTARGEVVFVVERAEFAPDFPASEWAYLKRGFMVRETDGTLVHYEVSHADLRLLSRAE